MVDGETGVVFRAGSKDNLVSAIRLMISDPQQIPLMGDNARRYTLANAPDNSQTYSTILHLEDQQFAETNDAATEFAPVGA